MDRRRDLADVGLFLLRLSLAAGMGALHGWPKLMGFDELAPEFPDPLGIGSRLSLGLAIASELGASVLLALGLLTRLVTLPLLVTMAVAAFVVHGGQPLGERELALAYLVGYFVVLLTGPGRFSLDRLIFRPRERSTEGG